jgi:hypothetical protein
MKLNLVLSAALVLSGSAAFGDTLNSGSSAATGTTFNPAGAFWNNLSSDTVNGSNAANVGDFLSASGSFAAPVAGCPTCGTNYMAGGGRMFVNAGNTPDYVSNLNFVRQAGALSITLLYANSDANGNAEFGIYDSSSPTNSVNNHLILQPGQVTNLNNAIGNVYTTGVLVSGSTIGGTWNLAAGSPYATWGLYVRTCEEGSVSFAQCNADGKIVTFYMGQPSQLGTLYAPYDTAHQHFALFQNGSSVNIQAGSGLNIQAGSSLNIQAGSNTNTYYAGLEDFAFSAAFPTNPIEGYGDFNDLIFGINSSVSTTPEPATLSIVGLGLVGLGFFGRRQLKK